MRTEYIAVTHYDDCACRECLRLRLRQIADEQSSAAIAALEKRMAARPIKAKVRKNAKL